MVVVISSGGCNFLRCSGGDDGGSVVATLTDSGGLLKMGM